MTDAPHIVETALSIATEAHRDQRDKAGAPYILHPIRVMLAQTDDAARAAALLHDVIEDCGWTAEGLAEAGIPSQVVVAVEALTRRPGEDYMDFVRRAAADPIAKRVKLADVEDNLDLEVAFVHV